MSSGVIEPDGFTTLEDLRTTVRRWCADHVPHGWQDKQTGVSDSVFIAFQQNWFATLRAAGIAVPHWPRAWGGGFLPDQQAVIFEELAAAEAPRLVLHFLSVHHAAATLLSEGTAEQQRYHLPLILDGAIWCQGFSEPNAGSDLASLQTRAVRHGDRFIVNGQKIWASFASHAQWCLLLVRTDQTAPMRRGISYLILDMRSPGIVVRPIRNARGEDHFCEIFLTDVEIPATNLIGPENDGWRVAQRTLTSERGATIVELSERLAVGFRWLCELASAVPSPIIGGPASADPVVRDRIARLSSEVQALRSLTARAIAHTPRASDRLDRAIASVIKLYYSELLQRLTALGVELTGLSGQRYDQRPASSGFESAHWLLDFIGSWEWTIPAGTSEIQRTIIGERALGLPREPTAS